MVDDIFLFHHFISLFLLIDRPTQILGVCVSPSSVTRVRLSHDFKIGSDFANFKIGTNFAVTLLRFIGADFIARKLRHDLSCDYLVMVVR